MINHTPEAVALGERYADRDQSNPPGLVIDPVRADLLKQQIPGSQGVKPVKTEPRTISARVGDLETIVNLEQNAHILFLHRLVDQCVDQIQALRHQLGMEEWTPSIRVEDAP